MIHMKEEDAGRVREILHRCCNWEDGECLPLGFPCPQRLSLTSLNCTWFRKYVLPEFPELEARIKNTNKEEEK